MVEINLTTKEIATLKRIAASTYPYIIKNQKLKENKLKIEEEIRNKLQSKLSAINDDIKINNRMIDLLEQGFKQLTGGFGVEQLFDKVVETKEDGSKTTTYQLKYPETIIPVTSEEPTTNIVSGDYCCNGEGVINNEVEF